MTTVQHVDTEIIDLLLDECQVIGNNIDETVRYWLEEYILSLQELPNKQEVHVFYQHQIKQTLVGNCDDEPDEFLDLKLTAKSQIERLLENFIQQI